MNFKTAGPNPFNEIPNHGKRSNTLDLENDSGREALLEIAKQSDVCLTSYERIKGAHDWGVPEGDRDD